MTQQLKQQLPLNQLEEAIQWDESGLVPAIVQDAASRMC